MLDQFSNVTGQDLSVMDAPFGFFEIEAMARELSTEYYESSEILPFGPPRSTQER